MKWYCSEGQSLGLAGSCTGPPPFLQSQSAKYQHNPPLYTEFVNWFHASERSLYTVTTNHPLLNYSQNGILSNCIGITERGKWQQCLFGIIQSEVGDSQSPVWIGIRIQWLRKQQRFNWFRNISVPMDQWEAWNSQSLQASDWNLYSVITNLIQKGEKRSRYKCKAAFLYCKSLHTSHSAGPKPNYIQPDLKFHPQIIIHSWIIHLLFDLLALSWFVHKDPLIVLIERND